MSRRAATLLAWGGWLVFVVLLAGGAVLDATSTTPDEVDESLVSALAIVGAFAAFATVGALVASRQPRNAVGWCFLGCPLFAALGAAAGEYGAVTFTSDPGSLPFGTLVAWCSVWAWFPAVALIGVAVLLFPDGRIPGRRWRYVLWLLVSVAAAMSLIAALFPGPLLESPGWPDNPIGIVPLEGVFEALLTVGGLALGGAIVAATTSVVMRFRRSHGDERQQLKWMAFSVSGAIVVIVPSAFLIPSESALGGTLFGLGIALIPLSAGIAMFKYRLYDIDRVISKTLVYAVLTAVLALTYVGLVLGAQAVFSSFAGGGDLAIAVSTLVVAALFLPVRARVQGFVDRRFYRRRYDAQRTLEAFGVRLREQMELDGLARELRAVVTETMQPASVSLWRAGGTR